LIIGRLETIDSEDAIRQTPFGKNRNAQSAEGTSEAAYLNEPGLGVEIGVAPVAAMAVKPAVAATGAVGPITDETVLSNLDGVSKPKIPEKESQNFPGHP